VMFSTHRWNFEASNHVPFSIVIFVAVSSGVELDGLI